MGEISSINFKKSNDIQTEHNDRNLPPNYLIGGAFECNRNHEQAEILKKQMIFQAKEIYTQRTKQTFQAKSYEWSAVVNIKDTTTMQDLENLAKHFSDKYGFQCYQIAIHRDEGHIDDNGQKAINHHAHLEFITLDKNTGRNLYNRQNISPKTLRQIQDEVAELLQMQRGVDKRISKVKRIEPRAYAQMKEKERANIRELKKELEIKHEQETKNLKTENKELKNENINLTKTLTLSLMEKFRKLTKNQGFTKEFYSDFNALKRDIKSGNKIFANFKELNKELTKLRKNNPPENLETKLQILDKKISKTNQDLGFLSQIEKNYDSEYEVQIKDENELNKFTELLQAYTPNIENLENKQEKTKIKEIFTEEIPKEIEQTKKFRLDELNRKQSLFPEMEAYITGKAYFFRINFFQAVKKVVENTLEHFKTDKEKLENEIKEQENKKRELNEQRAKEREKDNELEQENIKLKRELEQEKNKNSFLQEQNEALKSKIEILENVVDICKPYFSTLKNKTSHFIKYDNLFPYAKKEILENINSYETVHNKLRYLNDNNFTDYSNKQNFINKYQELIKKYFSKDKGIEL